MSFASTLKPQTFYLFPLPSPFSPFTFFCMVKLRRITPLPSFKIKDKNLTRSRWTKIELIYSKILSINIYKRNLIFPKGAKVSWEKGIEYTVQIWKEGNQTMAGYGKRVWAWNPETKRQAAHVCLKDGLVEFHTLHPMSWRIRNPQPATRFFHSSNIPLFHYFWLISFLLVPFTA